MTRPIGILQLEMGTGVIRQDLNRVIARVGTTAEASRTWEGRLGTWYGELPSDGFEEHGAILRISAINHGPIMRTCAIVVNDDHGRIELKAPMPHWIDDDGPSITAHVVDVVQTTLKAIDELEHLRQRDQLGPEPAPWLIAAAMLARRHEEPIEVSLPSPWTSAEAYADLGDEIEIDADRLKAFDDASPACIKVSGGSVIGSETSRYEFSAVNAVAGEGLNITDPIANMRAIAMATDAGAIL